MSKGSFQKLTSVDASETSAQSRLAFVDFDEADRAALRSARPTIAKALGPALDRFYSRISATPELGHFFSSDAHMTKAKGAQAEHWSVICQGEFGADYVERVTRIGRRHALIGLSPRWYLGGYAIVADELIDALANRKGLISRKRMAAEIKAFVKAMMIDIDFSISTYEDITSEEIIGKLGQGLSKLAEGDLTHRVEGIQHKFAGLQDDFNNTADHLARMVEQVTRAASSIHSGASEIRAAADDLAMRTERQAASLEETAAATNEVTATMAQTAKHAHDATTTIDSSYRQASEGSGVVARTVDAMSEIDRSSQEIANIINVIDGIALQTNLLALNAGVEAARAGEAGRGFAVVASEVRALAQRAAEASNDIRSLITASSAKVTEGVALVNETGAVLSHVLTSFHQISEMVGKIASSADNQAANLQQVNSAVGDMDRMTQQNAAMVEESTAATRSLASEATELARVVGAFTIASGTAAYRAAA